MLTVALSANSQFVTKPLNYQVPGDQYLPTFFFAVDADHLWVGTSHYAPNSQQIPYPYAVHTNDGGETWIFDSIPAPGLPYISNVSAPDENTCFYTFTDYTSDGSIWKTTDGGATWVRKTTTQFQGGYLNFYHASIQMKEWQQAIQTGVIGRLMHQVTPMAFMWWRFCRVINLSPANDGL